MSFKVYSTKNLPREKWSQLTNDSIYVSPEFASAWNTKGGREVFIVEESSNGFAAGLAGITFGRGLLKRFQSMPDGLDGGPYFSDSCSDTMKADFVQSFIDWLKSIYAIRADIHNPRCEIKSKCLARRETFTHVITLSDKSYQPPDAKIREHIRTGKRRGAVVGNMDSIEYLNDFYRLVVATEKRHGETPWYPKAFFEKFYEISRRDNRILWLTVQSDSRIIGSRICIIDDSQLLFWQFYSDKEYSDLKPGYLLMDHIINFAVEKGINRLNLGSSPPDAKSLIDYKQRWGGVRSIVPYYTYFSGFGKLIYKWKR